MTKSDDIQPGCNEVARAIGLAMFGYYEEQELAAPSSPSAQAMKAALAVLALWNPSDTS